MKKQVMEQEIRVTIKVAIPYEPGEHQSVDASNVWNKPGVNSEIARRLYGLVEDAEEFQGGQCTITVLLGSPLLRNRNEQEINLDANGAHNA